MVAGGPTLQLSATGTFGNAKHLTTAPLTSGVTWTSTSPGIAQVGASTGLGDCSRRRYNDNYRDRDGIQRSGLQYRNRYGYSRNGNGYGNGYGYDVFDVADFAHHHSQFHYRWQFAGYWDFLAMRDLLGSSTGSRCDNSVVWSSSFPMFSLSIQYRWKYWGFRRDCHCIRKWNQRHDHC